MDQVKQRLYTQVELNQITRREVELYVGRSFQADIYAILDDQQQRYIVVDVPYYPRPFPVGIIVMARVVGDYVIIDEDTTDKRLVDALIVNGKVPREQIILSYNGEAPPH